MKKMLALLLVVMMVLSMGGLRLEGRCGKYGDKSACRKRPRRFRRKGYH